MATLKPANENPWYVLMTLYGEQTGEVVDEELHNENRAAWNLVACQGLPKNERESLTGAGFDLPPCEDWQANEPAIRDRHATEMARRNKPGFPYPGFPGPGWNHYFNDVHFEAMFVADKFLFGGLASFESSQFDQSASFEYAIFGFWAKFGQATFRESTNFMQSQFRGLADFDSATFKEVALFSGVLFGGVASFDSAIFGNWAQFSRTTFGKEATFVSAEFKSYSLFENTAFCAMANFESATMIGDAKFSNAMFSGNAGFAAATFGGAARFVAANFGGEAWFSNATFGKYADFGRAKFCGAAEFDSTTFSEDVTFFAAKFSGYVYFPQATFGAAGKDHLVNFTDSEFQKPTIFRGATFHCYPDFTGTILHEKTTFTADAKHWPKSVTNPEAAKASAAVVRYSLGKQGLPEEEHFFFRREMGFATRIGGFWPRLPYRLYGWLSDFGFSIQRPVWWLLGLWLGPAAAFYIQADLAQIWGAQAVHWLQPLTLAFANVFTFFGFQRLYIDGEYLEHLPGWLKLLGALQSMIALPLLFFLGLGLRQRFRLR